MIFRILSNIKKNIYLRKIKYFIKSNNLKRLISANGAHIICLDIGAAVFEHTKWLTFLNSKKTIWIASDPSKSGLDYLKNWIWKSKLIIEKFALSNRGGKLYFYETNQKTGSSLKKINISENIAHRIDYDYFFPLKKKKIATKSIKEVIENYSKLKDIPIFIKIDIQGYESSLLKGLESFFKKKQICGLEIESSLLSEPIYKDGSKFNELSIFLEKKGFELLKFKAFDFNNKLHKHNTINECDSVFALKHTIINKKKLNYKIAMLQFYLNYDLNNEIKYLKSNNKDLKLFLEKNCIKIN